MTSGGRLLGKGSYGCVFDPPVECVDGIKAKGVGKVFKYKEAMEMEKTNMDIIRNIDPLYLFTNPIVHVCKVKLDKIRDDPDHIQCDLVTDQQDAYEQLVYKHVGIDFYEYGKANYCFSEDMMPKWNTFINGLLTMNTNKYAHFDLKPENMILTQNSDILLIDFGTTLPFSKVYDPSNRLLTYHYYVYPPEFKVFNYLQILKNDKLLMNMREDKRMNEYYMMLSFKLTTKIKYKLTEYDYIRRSFIKINNDLETIFYTQLEAFIEEVVNYMRRNDLTLENDMKPLFDQWVHKVDVFSFGVAMSRLLHNHSKTEHFEIIKRCVHPSPIERISMEQVQEYFLNHSSSKSKQLQCMTKYTLAELKDLVDERGLDKQYKKLSKKELCSKIYRYIEDRSEHPDVKRGRKSS